MGLQHTPEEVANSSSTTPTDLEKLIKDLYAEFEKDYVCVETILKLMANYKSNPAEWKKYAKFDRHRYTRNLVDQGNGKFNLMILCWGEGHGSAIHDHSDAHCFMKMLKGNLCETRFAWPYATQGDVGDFPPGELRETSRSVIATDDVCYINDSLGLHRVENPSHSDSAISLHLYSPPFDTCHVFNQQTGQKSKAQVTFWSKFGDKRNKIIQEQRAPEDN